jgi:hypothetical protein
LAAILVGSRDHRTHFWKGVTQGSFHKSLVAIGPVVSEEKIFILICIIGSTFDYPSWSYCPFFINFFFYFNTFRLIFQKLFTDTC